MHTVNRTEYSVRCSPETSPRQNFRTSRQDSSIACLGLFSSFPFCLPDELEANRESEHDGEYHHLVHLHLKAEGGLRCEAVAQCLNTAEQR